jgi:uncharacterized membrane protein YeaQ/YmgE (transglycosylase-associated protein family)
MLGFVLYLIVIGAIAGFIARALVPGPDPMGVAGTIVLGIFDEGALQASGVIGSIVGAILALLVYRMVSSRSGSGLARR